MVGGGPAGCAAAIVVAHGGATVALLERTGYDGLRTGETLPPDVRPLLDRLGAWDRFQGDGHLPAPGILAAWGQPEPYANDFVLNPYGCGWRLDRNRFDALLADVATSAGAVVHRRTTVDRVARGASGRWSVAAQRDGRALWLSAGALVDAGGRGSWLRSRVGARTVVHDRMVGLVAVAAGPSAGNDPDRRALIEATEHGWWYSASLPDHRLVLAFQTDAAPGLRARWPEFLAAAPHTAARFGCLGAAGVRLGPAGVRIVAANSQRAEPGAGDGWLAVGDAAAAHDPLAGLGIYRALESGIAGGQAVLSQGAGGAEAGPRAGAYAADSRARFERYLALRTAYYRAEARWPDAPFWRRRRLPSAVGVSG